MFLVLHIHTNTNSKQILLVGLKQGPRLPYFWAGLHTSHLCALSLTNKIQKCRACKRHTNKIRQQFHMDKTNSVEGRVKQKESLKILWSICHTSDVQSTVL